MSKQIAVVFEVTDDFTSEQLHEQLCRIVHEDDPEAQNALQGVVSDIVLLTDLVDATVTPEPTVPEAMMGRVEVYTGDTDDTDEPVALFEQIEIGEPYRLQPTDHWMYRLANITRVNVVPRVPIVTVSLYRHEDRDKQDDYQPAFEVKPAPYDYPANGCYYFTVEQDLTIRPGDRVFVQLDHIS